MSITERLEKLRGALGQTWAELGKTLGLSRSMLHEVRSGGRNLSGKALKRLAEVEARFGSPSGPFVDTTPKNWGGPYFGTSDGAPLISWAAAGDEHAYEDQGHDVPRIKTNCKDGNCYALEVEGDSMQPIYQAGDILIISPQLEARPGDLVMAKLRNDSVLFKKLQFTPDGKGIRLVSFNPNYPVMELKRQEVRKIQPVHSVIRPLAGKFF